MKKIQHVVFDFDGTIANSITPGLLIVNNFITTLGLQKLSEEDFEGIRGKSYMEIIEAFKIPLWRVPSLLGKLRNNLKKNIDQVLPYPHIPQVLKQLSEQGYNIYILTSNAADLVQIFLDNNDITVIDDVFSELNVFGKARAIKRFMKLEGIARENMIYIGDEIRDIEACKKALVPIISVTWGFNSKAILQEHHPDFIVDEPRDLVTVIESLG